MPDETPIPEDPTNLVAETPNIRKSDKVFSETWKPRLLAMEPGTWYNATKSWGVRRIDQRRLNELSLSLDDHAGPDGKPVELKVHNRTQKIGRKVDQKTGKVTRELELYIRRMPREQLKQ